MTGNLERTYANIAPSVEFATRELSGPPSQAVGAVIHGDFVQFDDAARCHACQVKNLRCALQQSDDGCMACAGANQECIFSRSVWTSGPKSTFDWSTLLGKESRRTPGTWNTPAPSTESFFGKAGQSRQAKTTQPRIKQSSWHPIDRTGNSQKILGRSNTSPEPDEVRSRCGVDPTNRDSLGAISHCYRWPGSEPWGSPLSNPQTAGTLPLQNGLTRLTTAAIPNAPDSEVPCGKADKDTNASQASWDLCILPDGYSLQSGRDRSIIELTSPISINWRKRIHESYPSLPIYLLERLVLEQARRFQRLVQHKSDHVNLRQGRKCPSGPHCLDENGYGRWLIIQQGSIISARSPVPNMSSHDSSREQANKVAQHRGASPSSDEDSAAETEDGNFAPRLPCGYPSLPDQEFPAEFECPLCFRVKKYHKQSDWFKHVHEDIQPFVCTFEHCPEAKAFKRKADWVRHENEGHRKLEWWTCDIKDCGHKCFRKDNFVQHLVREHKLPEPKARPSYASATDDTGKGSLTTVDTAGEQVWHRLEACWHGSAKKPEEEHCRFCGAAYDSWQKLTIHVARHMEGIAIPLWKTILLSDVHLQPIIGRMPGERVAGIVDTLPNHRSTQDDNHGLPKTGHGFSTKCNVAECNRVLRDRSEYLSVLCHAPEIDGLEAYSSYRKHMARHNKSHECQLCGKAFSTNNDLDRHKKSIHKLLPNNRSNRMFRCASTDCPKKDKLWPRLDNFRQHCTRIHGNEDIDELVGKSVIYTPGQGEAVQGT